MNQNLSSYWIFYVVANAKNISKAAKELYISQPAISKSIQKLEESLGCRLFARSSRGVILTPEGQLLYDHVKDAFDSLNDGEEKLRKSIELGTGHLNIGVSATLCKYLLLPYLKEFIRKNPHISISISCQSSNETIRLLEDNRIDIGLVGRPVNLKNMIYEPVEKIRDVFVASPDYLQNLHRGMMMTNEMLEKATLMLLDKNNMTRKYIDVYMEEHGLEASEVLEVSSMDLLIDFAKIGVGIAGAVRTFVEPELEEGSLVELAIPAEMREREVGFIYKDSHHNSEAMENFVNFCRSMKE